jgi:hypothetical protein
MLNRNKECQDEEIRQDERSDIDVVPRDHLELPRLMTSRARTTPVPLPVYVGLTLSPTTRDVTLDPANESPSSNMFEL